MEEIMLSKLGGVPMMRRASRILGWGVLGNAFAMSKRHT